MSSAKKTETVSKITSQKVINKFSFAPFLSNEVDNPIDNIKALPLQVTLIHACLQTQVSITDGSEARSSWEQPDGRLFRLISKFIIMLRLFPNTGLTGCIEPMTWNALRLTTTYGTTERCSQLCITAKHPCQTTVRVTACGARQQYFSCTAEVYQ